MVATVEGRFGSMVFWQPFFLWQNVINLFSKHVSNCFSTWSPLFWHAPQKMHVSLANCCFWCRPVEVFEKLAHFRCVAWSTWLTQNSVVLHCVQHNRTWNFFYSPFGPKASSWSVGHQMTFHRESFKGDSPKLGESSRLSPNLEESFKLSPKLGESFRGEFVWQERTVTHFCSCSKLSPKMGESFDTLP